MSWSDRFTRAPRRLSLRRAALRYAAHAWPVVPGARLRGDRFHCGQPGCRTEACHPAAADWESAASADPTRITAWWRRTDHGLLLATGHSFDVLELASPAGGQVARAVRGPVAVAPRQRWMFLVRPGGTLCDELSEHAAVVLHGRSSWIPAPPTRLQTGRVRWEVRPRLCGWQLPDPYDVQRAALRALGAEPRRPPVWRLRPATIPARE